MAFEIREGFKRNVNVAFTKADGSPGIVEGVPSWAAQDQTLVSLSVAADGMSCEVTHNGAVGDAIVTMTADGDLGLGVFPIVVSETFNMLAPIGSVAGGFSVGDEVPV